MLDDIVVNEFSERSALDFRNKVMRIAKLDPQRPITVYIDSYGGSVHALASMISVIEEVPNTFIMVAVGKAMSCGAILLAAGDYRFADKHSMMLIHEISAGSMGDVNDIKNSTENIIKMNEYWLDYLAKKCGKSGFQDIKDIIRNQDGRDINLNPMQAKEFGLVDYVGSPVITAMCVYGIENTNKDDPIKKQPMQMQEELPPELPAEISVDVSSPEKLAEFLTKLSDQNPEVKQPSEPKKKKKVTKKKVTKKKVTRKKANKTEETMK